MAANKEIEKAKKLFNNFCGEELGSEEYEIEIPENTIVIPVGRCDGIMYTIFEDGRNQQYLHRFKRSSAPTLCASSDGAQLYLIGGNYQFTETGINDI